MPDISVQKVEETLGIFSYDIYTRPESGKKKCLIKKGLMCLSTSGNYTQVEISTCV